MKPPTVKTIAVAIAVAIAAACAFVTYAALNEAYGSGPPYFGRTANMDKWASPVLFLVLLNSAGTVLALIVLRVGGVFSHKG